MNAAGEASTTSYSDRRARRLDDPRFERWRSPGARRWLVVAMLGLLAVEAALLMLAARAPWVFLGAFVVLVLAFVLCLGVLKASTRGVEELPAERLDERQAQLRGIVYARSYKIGSWLLIAALVVVALWDTVDLPTPGTGAFQAAAVIALQLVLVLPTMVAASIREL